MHSDVDIEIIIFLVKALLNYKLQNVKPLKTFSVIVRTAMRTILSE